MNENEPVEWPADAAPEPVRAKRRPWLRWLFLLLAAFAAGLFAMGWVLTRWDAAAPYLSWLKEPAATSATTSPPRALAPSTGIEPEAATAMMESRIGELQRQIDTIASRAETASGNADRAEGLLIAFAARRAIDRGLSLGYLEGLLRERFGQQQPRAVATILSAGHQPVTLDQLKTEFETIAPALSGAAPDQRWWDAVRQELAEMIVIRRADMPSARVGDRVARARNALATGRVEMALAEVNRLPARHAAAQWMAHARRYVAAHDALDTIETAALLNPAHRTMIRLGEEADEEVVRPDGETPAAAGTAGQSKTDAPRTPARPQTTR